MNKHFEQFANQLLQQDKFPNEKQYEEYQMELTNALAKTEKRANLTTWTLGIAFSLAFIVAFIHHWFNLGSFVPGDDDATVITVIMGVFIVICQLLFPITIGVYFLWLRPRIIKLKEQLLDAKLAELRHDVSELRNLIVKSQTEED